jgi:hypothetical protein
MQLPSTTSVHICLQVDAAVSSPVHWQASTAVCYNFGQRLHTTGNCGSTTAAAEAAVSCAHGCIGLMLGHMHAEVVCMQLLCIDQTNLIHDYWQ